jgi:hypothetical protein
MPLGSVRLRHASLNSGVPLFLLYQNKRQLFFGLNFASFDFYTPLLILTFLTALYLLTNSAAVGVFSSPRDATKKSY